MAGRRLALVGIATVLVWGLGAAAPAAADRQPYSDPTLPVATRVADLMSRMSLDDKLGQMTQAERAAVSPADVTTYRLGSVLSGGGSAPVPNTPAAWADMIDGFQAAALATPLGIPLLYGTDAVHGHNNLVGATIFPHNIGLGAAGDPTWYIASARPPPRRWSAPESGGTSPRACVWHATTAGGAPTSRSARRRSCPVG